MRRSSLLFVGLLSASLSCGQLSGSGANGSGPPGDSGRNSEEDGAGGKPDAGGASLRDAGGASDATTDAAVQRDGAAQRDAAPSDASDDAVPPPCTVTVDGSTMGCTTQIVSGNDNDVFCGLKPDGQMACWASEIDAYLFGPFGSWPAVIAKAPARLAQLAVSNGTGGDVTFCGVDQDGNGTCWGMGTTRTMGSGLKAVVLSTSGTCSLDTQGAVTCDTGIQSTPPATSVYAKILASEDSVMSLDVAGVPRFPPQSFPDGVYVDIATNDATRAGAVRSDGTAVATFGGTQVVKAGSFTHIALDYGGRACALDADGAVTCWIVDTAANPTPIDDPPAGPFVQIVGAETTFCAIRTTGTTACWGDHSVAVPAGW